MDDSQEILAVLCNCPDDVCAQSLAQGLVEAGLAACVNQLPPVQSVYRWQGRTEIAMEVPLLVKTTRSRYPALQAWLVARHPYDVPEIVAWPISIGLPAYLQWVHHSVSGTTP
ncbi:divalent-cation tolerance protein CutA [Chitiniphilus purpureus]|uniref:Divalent-cation tolerance protein CutA n=1 Tax=Chitiniphilus purpureus TaxID=2981137 RepID=A0ABY6DK23_9NEIS|nr:divalent-cation tolerance protein CutA [Chitiniphilus sp. CD1]UXY14714.1 divalent-cation tolerance protein CutA [Chitiniphilus sp. CD1]